MDESARRACRPGTGQASRAATGTTSTDTSASEKEKALTPGVAALPEPCIPEVRRHRHMLPVMHASACPRHEPDIVCAFRPFLAIGMTVLGYGARAWWRSHQVAEWPTVQGTFAVVPDRQCSRCAIGQTIDRAMTCAHSASPSDARSSTVALA